MQQEMPTDIVNTFAVIQSSLVHTNTADKTQPVSRYKHSTSVQLLYNIFPFYVFILLFIFLLNFLFDLHKLS